MKTCSFLKKIYNLPSIRILKVKEGKKESKLMFEDLDANNFPRLIEIDKFKKHYSPKQIKFKENIMLSMVRLLDIKEKKIKNRKM